MMVDFFNKYGNMRLNSQTKYEKIKLLCPAA